MLSKSMLDALTFGGLFGSYFDSYDVANTRNQEITQTEWNASAYSGYDDDYFHAYSRLLEEN